MEAQKKGAASRPFQPVRESIDWLEQVKAERAKALEIRRAERKKPVYDQSTYATRTYGSVIPELRAEIAKIGMDPKEDPESENAQIQFRIDEANLNSYREKLDQRSRISRYELLADKRRIFHRQFGILSKKEAIRQIIERADVAEKEADDREVRLGKESIAFDEHLHDANAAAISAMQEADEMSRQHRRKNAEIKKITGQIAEIRSEICRMEDKFGIKDEIKQFINLVHHNTSTSDNKPISMDSPDWIAAWNTIYSTRDKNPFSPNSGVDLLLERIEELETRNLSLIGHFQHSEEAFDEVKKVFEKTEHRLGKQIQDLQEHMEMMKTTEERFTLRSEELEFYCNMFGGDAGFDDQDAQLAIFEKEIAGVYADSTGQKSLEITIDALSMLTFIETRLEDLIEAESRLPPARVKAEQNERDKQRRIEAREQMQRESEEKQRERAERAKNRNATDMMMRIGRKLNQRSRPPNKRQNLTVEVLEEDPDAEFFRYD